MKLRAIILMSFTCLSLSACSSTHSMSRMDRAVVGGAVGGAAGGIASQDVTGVGIGAAIGALLGAITY
jgi:hypothetical protein